MPVCVYISVPVPRNSPSVQENPTDSSITHCKNHLRKHHLSYHLILSYLICVCLAVLYLPEKDGGQQTQK